MTVTTGKCEADPAADIRFTPFFLASFPAVFLLGTGTIIVTVFVFYLHRPDYFYPGWPTLSRAAAFPPSSYLFAIGMTITTIFIHLVWLDVFRLNRFRMDRLAGNGASVGAVLPVLSVLACANGMLAGLSLALLAIVNSEWLGAAHEVFSIVFFASQAIACLLDGIWWRWAQKLGGFSAPQKSHRRGRQKVWLVDFIILLALVFLGLYLGKLFLGWGGPAFARLFAGVEYTLAVAFFYFPYAYFREIKAGLSG